MKYLKFGRLLKIANNVEIPSTTPVDSSRATKEEQEDEQDDSSLPKWENAHL